MTASTPRLHMRLRSCLQAILNFEPEIQEIEAAELLLTELSVLKGIYNKIETLHVQEEDVQRIEAATASFFEELKENIRRDSAPRPDQRFLQ